MKFVTALTALGLVAVVAASPVALPEPEALPEAFQGIDISEFDGPVDERDAIQLGGVEARDLAKRQSVGSTATELENGACRRIIFIFARGSTEPGNLGSTVGPATCNQLKSAYGSSNVACQGVGGAYTASLAANTLPQGTTPGAIAEAQRLFNLANTKCPNSVITGGGYSQGGAVIHGAVPGLGSTVRSKIRGLVYYGDSRQQQTGGQTGGIPSSNVLEICNTGDPICRGTLVVNAAHLSYVPTVPQAVTFLRGRIGA